MQDLATPFLLNSLTFDSSAGAFHLTGGGLDFRSNGTGTPPSLTQNSANAISIDNNLTLSNDLTVNTSGPLTFTGSANGPGGLIKTGTGTLLLSGNNVYSSTTTINGGNLQISGGSAIPDTSAVTVATGATFDVNSSTETIGSLAGGGSTTLGTGSLIVGADNTNVTFSGVISGAGNLAKIGTGVLLLSANNSLTGTTTIQGGSVVLTGSSTSGKLSGSTFIRITNATLQSGDSAVGNNRAARLASAAVLALGDSGGYGAGTFTFGLTSRSSGIIQTLDSLHLDIGANVIKSIGAGTHTATLQFNDASAQLVRSSGSTLDVTTATNFVMSFAATGRPSLVGGILGGYATVNNSTWATLNGSGVVGGLASYTNQDNAALWAAGQNITNVSGFSGTLAADLSINSLRFNGAGGTVTIAAGKTLTLASGGILASGSPASAGAISGGNITSGNGQDLVAQNFSSQPLNINSNITGPIGLTVGGTATVTLGLANSYTGGTFINTGTASLGATNALPANTAVTIISGATLSLNSFNAAVSMLNGSGTVNLGTGTLTLGNSTTNNTVTANLSGNGSFNKTGSNLVSLSGANTYSGTTTVGAGTLALPSGGSLNNSASISVAGGAAFDVSAVNGYTLAQNLLAKGTGTANIAGTVNAAGRTLDLQDGTNLGTLTFGSGLTLNNSVLKFDLGSTGSDQISLAGGATLGGANTINVAPLISATTLATGTHAYTLVTAAGGLGSTFTLSNSSATLGGTTYNFTLSGDATHEYLNVTSTTPAPTQTFTYGTPTNPVSAHANATVNLSGTLSNTGGGSLAINLSSTGSLLVNSLTPASGTISGGNSTTVTGTIHTGGTAGPQTWQITNNDPNATDNPINISGTVNVYNLAAAAGTQTVNVGATHAGVATTASVTLFNTAPTDATYTETLSTNGFSSTTSGFTATGSAAGIAGRSIGSGTLSVGLGATLSAGHQIGGTTLALNSNAVNGSGLGTTGIGSQAITITGDVYNLAVTNTIGTVNLGVMHVGGTKSTAITLTNTSPADATYTETLTSSGFTGTSANFTAAGAIGSALTGTQSNSASLSVGLGAGLSAGQQNGTTTLNLTSNEVNSSGLGNTNSTQSVTIIGDVFSGNAKWIANSPGSWGGNANWTDTVTTAIHAAPGTFGAAFDNLDAAVFDGTGTGTSVTLDVVPSLKSIGFSGGAGYTINSGASAGVTLKSNGGNASITASAGNSTIGVPITTASNTNISTSGSASLNLSGGIDNSAGKAISLNNTSTGALSTGAITNNGTLFVEGAVAGTGVSGSGTTNVGTGATGNGSLSANKILQTTLNIGNTNGLGNATVTINASSPSTFPPTGNSSGTSVLASLSIANNGAGLVSTPSAPSNYYGTLDLMNNNLVINYTGTSPIAQVRDAIWSAYNGGTWDGKGLTSSLLAANPSAQYALAYGENNVPSTFVAFDNSGHPFDGTPVAAQSVLVKFTWQDDLNLDGVTDITDASAFGNNFDFGATHGHTFAQGDLNYDGVIDITDSAIFGNAFITGLTPLPEPSSFLLAAIGLIGLLFARRTSRSRRYRDCQQLEIALYKRRDFTSEIAHSPRPSVPDRQRTKPSIASYSASPSLS